MKLTRIDILSIPVSDPMVSKLFYTEKLGFEVIQDMPMGPQGRWIQLGLPGAATSISLVTWFDAMPRAACKAPCWPRTTSMACTKS